MSKRSTSCGWQVNKTIVECNRHMLRNRIGADVCLEVGKPDAKKTTRFYAHQYVLVSRSPVFQALFSKEKHGGSKDEIPITRINDVTPSALESILKYLYCEEVAIDECSVFSVLAAAKKFRVASLLTICYDFLESHLSVKTSCEFLQRASVFTGDPFIMQCLHFIWNHAEKVLDSSSFTKLSEQMLKAIVSSDYVAIPETHIFKAVVRWAERQCTMHGVKPTPDSLRRSLGDLIYTIRFPLMDPSEFANLVGHSGLLTNEEMSDIYTQILTTGDPRQQQSRFLRNPRTPKSVLTRFSLAVKRAPGDNQGELADDAITFNTDHDILLCGIGIYGGHTPARIHVHFQLFVNDREPMSLATDLTVECDGRPEPYELAMPVPVYMKKLQPYTVVISVMGDMTYCGHRGVGKVSCGGVTFCFSKSGLSGNNTSVETGQIPQLIFYKSPS